MKTNKSGSQTTTNIPWKMKKQIYFKADNEIIKPPRIEILESDAEEKTHQRVETKMVNQEEPDVDEITNSSSNLSAEDFFSNGETRWI